MPRRRGITGLVAALLAPLGLAACSGAPAQIVSLDPVNGSSGVAADAPVRVAFDHAVDRGSLPGRFHVDPAIDGCPLDTAFAAPSSAACHVEWSADSQQLALVHAGAIFRPDTRYRFTLDPGVRDANGVTNDLDHNWTLTTESAPGLRNVSPGDGSAGVGLDTPMVLSFSTAMSPGSTAAAVSLDPAVPGTRVAVNASDPGRLVVVPGVLLSPRTTYTLAVAATATNAHGSPTGRAETVHFTTGETLSNRGHAVILARRPEEPPSVVLLGATAPDAAGDPVSTQTILAAPRCPAARCGLVHRGGPLVTYAQPALSSSGLVAVVTRDLTTAGAPAHLDVVDLGRAGAPRPVAVDAAWPSWSPDGRVLAYGSGGTVALVPAAGGIAVRLPHGDGLDGRAGWSGDGSVLVLPLIGTDGRRHVELGDPALRIRYPVPSPPPAAESGILSQDGSTLAVAAAGIGGTRCWVVGLRVSDAAPRQLGDHIRPVAFVGPGALLGVSPGSGDSPALVRVSIAGGDVDTLGSPLTGADPGSVVAGAGGRTVGFVARDATGIDQAMVVNADGSNPVALTAYDAGSLEVVEIDLPA